MVSVNYYGERDEVQAVFVAGRVVNVRLASLFNVWDGRASAWETVKRFN